MQAQTTAFSDTGNIKILGQGHRIANASEFTWPCLKSNIHQDLHNPQETQPDHL